MQLLGGRKLTYERSFHSAREVKPKRGFWKKVLDFVAGEPDFHTLVRPYSVATDSRGRIIVTDPGAYGVHIFDFKQQKYKFLFRADKGKDPMLTPQCVAVDAQDNIYVTDSESGKVFIFNSERQVSANHRQPEGRRRIFQAAHRDCGRFCCPTNLRNRYAARQDLRDGHAG